MIYKIECCAKQAYIRWNVGRFDKACGVIRNTHSLSPSIKHVYEHCAYDRMNCDEIPEFNQLLQPNETERNKKVLRYAARYVTIRNYSTHAATHSEIALASSAKSMA